MILLCDKWLYICFFIELLAIIFSSVDDGAIEVTSLDALFTDSDVDIDASDSDGYLSEVNHLSII